MAIDLESYSRQAEQFASAIDLEYYLHFSGQKAGFELEAIYERYEQLFSRDSIEQLRELGDQASGDAGRRLSYLLQLAIEGLLGQASKAEAAELAEREGAIELDVLGERVSYRSLPVRQANEPDAERRQELEQARLGALERELNPLDLTMIERTHELVRELGWESYLAMYEQLKDLDLRALEQQTKAFADATSPEYRIKVDPVLLEQLDFGFDRWRRADMGRFFRAPDYDKLFPGPKLVEAFERTFAGLGIDVGAQVNVTLDLDRRPRKSPRAFCAPVHVPLEVYLVVPLTGGREDYAALMHESGHTEHYANVDPGLQFEFRHLGDNSVTESFAFLFEHLTEDPVWLESMLGVDIPDGYVRFTRAVKLIYLRRYAAKLSYELELHGGRSRLSKMPQRYASGLGEAIGVDWPTTTYLADVDGGFYAANYLRAWALETHWRRHLRSRFGERWFESREAGGFLLSLWSQGQRLPAHELLTETLGEQLRFDVMLDEV